MIKKRLKSSKDFLRDVKMPDTLEKAVKEAETFHFEEYGEILSVALSLREGSRLRKIPRIRYRRLSWEKALREAKALQEEINSLVGKVNLSAYCRLTEVTACRPEPWDLKSNPVSGLQSVIIGCDPTKGKSFLRATIYVEPCLITESMPKRYTSVARVDFAPEVLDFEQMVHILKYDFVLRCRLFREPFTENAYAALWRLADNPTLLAIGKTDNVYTHYNLHACKHVFGGHAKLPPIYR